MHSDRIERSAPGIPPAGALVVAVLAMSWAGPLVRFTDAPALVVSAWRLVLSVAFIAVVILARRETRVWPRLGRGDLALALASGVLLAAHFWSWIASLEYTSVASSVVLVNTQPLFVALMSAMFLGERATARQWAGIAIAMIGAAVIGLGDWRSGAGDSGRAPLLGDALAVAGAVFVSIYYVIGRRLRQQLDLWHYVGIVYGAAAITLVIATIAHPSASLSGHGRNDWLVFIALAAGPMMLGHTGVNYALRYVRAYVANLVILAEPVGATLIAWLLPSIRETPPLATMIGGPLVLMGIALGTLWGPRASQSSMDGTQSHA
jgi:drug/metabolite transporter (DMT)-like permease